MDILSKSEKDLMKILPIAFPIAIIAVILIFFTTKHIIQSAIEPFEKMILHDNVVITLCENVPLKSELVKVAFKNFRYTKVSGSSPGKLYLLSSTSGSETFEFSVGQDSKKNNLFWLYPKQTETYIRGSNFGFIESEYIKDNIEKCV